MPDPLSVASAVTGLLSLTIQLSQVLHEQIHIVKNAPKYAQELLNELEVLRQVLAQLDGFLKDQTAKGLAFKQTSILINAVKGCDIKIDAIKRRLDKLVQSKGWTKLVEKGKWFYEHEEHQELITTLHRYVGLFQMSLSTEGIDVLSKSVEDVRQVMTLLKSTATQQPDPQHLQQITKQFDDVLQLLSPVSDLSKDVKEVLHRTQRWDAKWQDQESSEIVSWLSPLNFWTKQDDFFSRKEKDTGGWIFEDDAFKDWMNGVERILWCPGIPGAGKTILASTVIDHLRNSVEDDETRVAFVFCNYKEKETQTAVSFVASLVQQLLQRKPGVPETLQALYQKHAQKRTRPTLAEFSNLLRLELTTCSRVFIVIDALDECDDTCGTRGDFISHLLQLPPNTSLMITSRKISSIEEELGKFRRLEIRARDYDVQTYLEGFIERTARLKRHVQTDPTLKETIVNKIVNKVDGMFLLAQLHIESLGKKHNRRAVREALDNLPKGLDATYDDAMARIHNQDEDDVLLAEKILCWLSYTMRPLTLRELQEAVAVKAGDQELDAEGLDDENIMVSVCAGLVTIDEESNVFRLIHYTTQEYFVRKRLEWFPQGQVDIVTACLAYLSLDAFNTGYIYEDEEMQARLDRYPFLQYASNYWGVHSAQETESTVQTKILKFLAQDENVSCSFQVKDLSTYRKFNGWSQRAPEKIPGLLVAAAFGLQKTAEALLAQHINVNVEDSRGSKALHHAARRGHEGIVRMLLERDAAVETSDEFSNTVLYAAAQRGHESIVRMLLERGAAVEASNKYGNTVLYAAARGGHEGTVRMLLERGAAVEASNQFGNTALHVAAGGGHEGTVRMLLERGAAVEASDKYDDTALHLAAKEGHEDIVLMLLEKGAVELPNQDGETALFLAAKGWHEGTMKILENHVSMVGRRKVSLPHPPPEFNLTVSIMCLRQFISPQ